MLLTRVTIPAFKIDVEDRYVLSPFVFSLSYAVLNGSIGRRNGLI